MGGAVGWEGLGLWHGSNDVYIQAGEGGSSRLLDADREGFADAGALCTMVVVASTESMDTADARNINMLYRTMLCLLVIGSFILEILPSLVFIVICISYHRVS